MKKILFGFLLILVVALVILWTTPVISFIPRRLEEGSRNRLIRARELETKEFYDRLEAVLKYYDIRFKASENNTVLVSLQVILNKELSWNYTKKAQDPEWLSNVPACKLRKE